MIYHFYRLGSSSAHKSPVDLHRPVLIPKAATQNKVAIGCFPVGHSGKLANAANFVEP